jgi:hypothetical protein
MNMRTRLGWIAIVVLCCAAGTMLQAARTSQATDGARISCASVPATSSDVGVDHPGRLEPAASDNRKGGCGPHVQACSASHVGQPCSPNNLNIICSAQSNGAYCCLAYAP